jgi:protein TonB
VLHVIDAESVALPVPACRIQTIAVSAAAHLLAGLLAATIAGHVDHTVTSPAPSVVTPRLEPGSIVFIASAADLESHGGGGGGNRQTGPIRHAEAIGADAMTLRTATPVATAGVTEAPASSQLLLDAKPLASGTNEHVGLPVGGVSFGTSTGSGSGGGVGEGIDTGTGPGRGPGFGPGSGGGIGGGVYRPGGSVTTPRVVAEVRPRYTSEALEERIQGTVVLELVVRATGRPAEIRVIRSLDPGLDAQAIIAASQWRFEPGRLAGRPVDVQVVVMMDFQIR